MSAATVIELDPTASLLSRIRNGAWLDAQKFPPLQWAVKGIIPEGFGLLVGPPKLGKSWFALGVGLAAAWGGRAFGRIDVQQRPVLYAALEDGPRRIQSRVNKLLEGQATPEAFEFFTDATPGEILPILSAWLDRHPTGLVMLDTLGKVMPPALGGESAYQRDYRVGGALKALSDAHPGSTLLVVHHTRKGASSDWMDSTSGTQGLNGSADFTIVLERGRGEGAAVVKVTGRDVMENEYAMTMDGGRWALQGANLVESSHIAKTMAATAGLDERSAATVEFVNEHPEGVRANQLATALGLSDKDAGTYLLRAYDSGRITKFSRGLYGPVGSVGSVGNRDSDPPLPTHPTLPTHPLGEEPGW